jgi:hypothetical protein
MANPVNSTDPSGHDDILEVEESQIISEELDEAEDTVSVNEYIQTAYKIEQELGSVDTFAAVCEGFVDPQDLGDYFGGLYLNGFFLNPFRSSVVATLGRDAIGIAADARLIQIALSMAVTKITYVPDPLLPSNWYAAVVPKLDARKIDIAPGWVTLPIFTPPDTPLAPSDVTVLIHEFAHLVSKGSITDNAYYRDSLALLPNKALYSADNYRIAVQALISDISAEQAFNSFLPGNRFDVSE